MSRYIIAYRPKGVFVTKEDTSFVIVKAKNRGDAIKKKPKYILKGEIISVRKIKKGSNIRAMKEEMSWR